MIVLFGRIPLLVMAVQPGVDGAIALARWALEAFSQSIR